MTSDYPAHGEMTSPAAVHELVLGCAEAGPDVVAVVCGDVCVTYGALVGRAGVLAGLLRVRGVGVESVVGVCVERGVEMVVAVLGVWLAGAAFVPLDPGYPAERLRFMLADSGACVVVAQRQVAGVLGELDELPVVWLDELAAAGPAVVADRPVHQGSLAYVMYTSGSTGRPKGVLACHGGLLNLTAGIGPWLGAGRGRRALQFASFGFDAAVLDIAVVLAGGGTLVVATKEERADPGRLAGLVRSAGVQAASVVPSLLSVLDPAEVPGLETVLVGGERLSEAVGRAWSRGRRLVNTYGPTEATVMVTAGPVRPDGPQAPPIGAPLANVGLFVLDGGLRLVPAGVAGELFVGGVQVGRGYAGRAGLTAERFVADPFSSNGGRLYRTGDRVRWRGDGELEFVGRVDDQVKVRGFRVELGEVEGVLAGCPGVRAAVVAAAGEGAERRLVGFVVAADPVAGVPSVAVLREYLRTRLPAFMIPAAFAELPALPLTMSGKLDRGALPAPDQVQAGVPDGFVAPGSPTEEMLAGIWAQVLGVDRVGARDDFFDLGGHSLLATQMMSRARKRFGIELAITALFDHPVLRDLAAVIDKAGPRPPAPPVTPVPRDQPLRLSFGQQRLWFLHQLDPRSTEYVRPTLVRLPEELDAAALSAALTAVVARHEVLRTRLVADPAGQPGQVVDPPGTVPLPAADVSGRDDPVAAARSLVAGMAATPFDLAAGPLIRAMLIRLGPEGHLLALCTHHVVFDDRSASIFRRELSVLYESFRAGEPDPLPPLPVQYADFAAWQRAWLTEEILAGQLAYWRDQLAGVPVLELPADRPRPPVRISAGSVARFRVPAPVAGGLREVARQGGATMFMVLLAAFAVVLGRYSGLADVAVGSPVTNRNRAELENLIGFFVNTVVFRADVSGNPSFAGLVSRVRTMALAAYAHQDLPFEQVVDALVTERDRSRTELFQVFFDYASADPRAGGLGPEPEPVLEPMLETVAVPSDLAVTISESPGGASLDGVIEYSTALFDPETAGRLAGHLGTVLEAVAGGSGARLDGLPMLTAAERDALARGRSETAVPAVSGVHELVVGCAVAGPDVVAVVCGDVCVTYGGLVGRAIRLAGLLAGRGVGAESVVGVCAGRGVEMVVAVLGVWLAGAAFVPLDPGYPAERVRFMLADSGAAVVVAQRVVAGVLGGTDEAGEMVAGLPAVWLDDLAAEPAGSAGPAEVVAGGRVRGGSLAYVMYTSGSTGRPKGVLACHAGLLNLTAGLWPLLGTGRAVTGLGLASFSFDAAVWEMVIALAGGGTLVVASEEERADPGRLAGLVRSAGVTVGFVPPSLLRVLTPGDLDGLETLITGAERLDAELAATWRARHRLLNAYGPTEATVCVSVAVVDEEAGAPPIGRPVPNVGLFVLDGGLRLVPAGVAGELFVGGVQVGRGYAGRAGLTAERFVADPFSSNGGRLYRTGDRVRWRGDGELEFVGRVDDQVKVRGFRVELGEVEGVLAGCPGVRAAVVAAAGEGAERRLVGFVVAADPVAGVPSVAVLREYLRTRLPAFMIPAAFTGLPALPLTPAGKPDRNALLAAAAAAAAGASGPEPARDYVAPATAAEEAVAGIWAQVLSVDRVGAEDNFFELGGHSLLALRVIAGVRDEFGSEVPVSALFDQPTVRGLARRLG